MIRCYIAGPIRKGDLAGNIKRACDVGRAFAKLGYAIMVPHLSCYFDGTLASPSQCRVNGEWNCDNDGIIPQAVNSLNAVEWLAIDLAWIEAADILVRINGESEGADAEVKHAEMMGIPVFYVDSVEDVSDVHCEIQMLEKVAL